MMRTTVSESLAPVDARFGTLGMPSREPWLEWASLGTISRLDQLKGAWLGAARLRKNHEAVAQFLVERSNFYPAERLMKSGALMHWLLEDVIVEQGMARRQQAVDLAYRVMELGFEGQDSDLSDLLEWLDSVAELCR